MEQNVTHPDRIFGSAESSTILERTLCDTRIALLSSFIVSLAEPSCRAIHVTDRAERESGNYIVRVNERGHKVRGERPKARIR